MPQPPSKRRRQPRNRAPRPGTPDGPERAYVAALRRLTGELARTARQFVEPAYARWLAGQGERLDAALDTSRADAVDRIGIDWGKLLTILGRVVSDQAPDLAEAQAKRVAGFNLADMSRVLGIDLADEPAAVRRQLERWRRENVSLIKSIAVELHDDVRRVVRAAAREGRRVEDLAGDLRERFGVQQSRAELIARDQTLSANSDLSRIRLQEAGVTRYVWSTSRDERVRPMHQALDGRIFTLGDPPVTNEAGERNEPGQEINCRCVRVAILD